MALTGEGALLTEAHRIAQARIAEAAATDLATTWQLLDVADLDATSGRWLGVAVPVVERQWAASVQLASTYLSRFRTTEGIGGTFAPLAAGFNADRAAISLLATGPGTVRARSLTGLPLAEASRSGVAAAMASGGRLALTGGRDTVLATTTADPAAQGVRRIASAGCCAFCALLTGNTYRSVDTASFQAHDGCHCQPEPAYSIAEGATRQQAEFADLYARAKADAVGTGDGPLNSLRKLLAEQRAT